MMDLQDRRKMAKQRRSAEANDAAKTGTEAAKTVRLAIDAMINAGEFAGIEKVVKELARRLDIPREAFSDLLERARQAVDAGRAKTGEALKTAAKEAGCQFDYRPPNAEFGCVLLRERSPGQWSLSILDNVSIETCSTTDGSALGEVALRHITEIEKALGGVDQFAKDLVESATACRRTDNGPLPANLLMLLTSFGRGLKRELVSSKGTSNRPGLSRAEFGFLLARLHRLARKDQEYPQLSFVGAAQGDAAKAHHFLAVPDADDPRKKSNRRLISAITVST